MKLIKLTDDHYIIIDDSPIKEGDWMVRNGEQPILVTPNFWWDFGVPYKKITHSTQPIEEFVDNEGIKRIGWVNIKVLELSKIKELIGEVDVEKKAEESFPIIPGTHPNINWDRSNLQEGFVTGYNQAIEDNKDKKYTENQAKQIWKAGQEYWKTSGTSITFEELTERMIKQPKTEWEVEWVDGKLKLK